MDGGGLGETAAAIVADIERRRLAVFPGFPLADAAIVAVWPDGDWSAFLDLAQRVGCPLVYFRADQLTPEELEPFEEVVDLLERETLAELTGLLREAAGRRGEVFGVRLGFMSEGVLHDWTRMADWYERLLDLDAEARAASAGEFFGRRPSEAERNVIARADEWAVAISEDRRFVSAGNEAARREAAAQIVPDLGVYLVSDGTPFGQRMLSVALDVLRRAETRLRGHVKPRIEAEMAGQLDDLAGELAGDDRFRQARTKEERRRVAAAFVAERAGFRVPSLVDPLLRQADPQR